MGIMLSDKHGVNPAVPRCFYCMKDKDLIYLLGKTRGDVEAPHGAVWDMEPCEKCKKWMKEGIIVISVRDDQGQELVDAHRDNRPPNPYRTGGFWVIKHGVLDDIFDEEIMEEINACGWTFIPDEVIKAIGLFELEGENDGSNTT